MLQQQNREAAEKGARYAAQTGDKYLVLLADGALYLSKEDTRRAARTYREAIALRPDEPVAYFNLGAALGNSGHHVEGWRPHSGTSRPRSAIRWARRTGQRPLHVPSTGCRRML